MFQRNDNFEWDREYKIKFCHMFKKKFENKGAQIVFDIPDDPQSRIDIYATAITIDNRVITYAIELKDRGDYKWNSDFAKTEGWVIEDDKLQSGEDAMDISGYTEFVYANIFHLPTPKVAIWNYPFSFAKIPEKEYHKTTVGKNDSTYRKEKKGLLNKDAKWYEWNA